MANNKSNKIFDIIVDWINQTFPYKQVTVDILQEFCNLPNKNLLQNFKTKSFGDVINIIDNNNYWDVLPYILEQDRELIKCLSFDIKCKLLKQLQIKSLYNFSLFYTVIRWGNIDLLDILITINKLDDYISNKTSGNRLDELISYNLNILLLRNVKITDDIKRHCEKILFDIRFIAEEGYKDVEISEQDRIEFILKLITELEHNYTAPSSLILLTMRTIADNLFILKNKVRKPLNQLPWGQMEFFLAAFINKLEAGYELTLSFNADDLIRYLILFKNLLINYKNNIPITTTCFNKFYKEFELNRSYLALTRISRYMKTICDFKVDSEVDDILLQYAIERCVQVTGENLKSSEMSPNISIDIEQVFEKSAPNFLKAIRNMRDSLSHVEYLESRLKMDNRIYIKLRKELKIIYPKIVNIIYMQQYSKFERLIHSSVSEDHSLDCDYTDIILSNQTTTLLCVNTSCSSSNINVVTAKSQLLTATPYLDDYLNSKLLKACMIQDDDSNTNNMLLYYYCKNFKTKNTHELLRLLLDTINNIYDIGKIEDTFISTTYDTGNILRNLFKVLIHEHGLNFDQNCLKLSKQSQTKLDLDGIDANIQKAVTKVCFSQSLNIKNFDDCIKLEKLIKSLIIFIEDDSDNIKDEYNKIKNQTMIQLFHNKIPGNKRQWTAFANQLKTLDYEIFRQKIYDLCNQEKTDNILKEFKKFLAALYGNSISINLKGTIDNWLKPNVSHLMNPVRKRLAHLIKIEKTEKLHNVALEMCILDILEMHKNDLFANNNAPFYDSYPVLMGKVLRNHLAHYNILFERFPNNQSLFLTANKLTDENVLKVIFSNNLKIGSIKPIKTDDLFYRYNFAKQSIFDQLKLFQVAQNGTLQDFKYCLMSSCDISSNLDYCTVAKHAVIGNNLDVFHYLLNITEFDLELKTLAIQNNSVAIFQLLLKLTGINGDEMHQAVLYNKINIAKILVELSNSKLFINNLTPLHLSCLLGRAEIAYFLLQNNAEIEVRDATFNAPVHIAAIMGHEVIVKHLIENQVEINSFGSNNKTALHFAAGNGHKNLVQLLISNQININCQDSCGQTALHLAARSGYDDIINVLLKNKAKVVADIDGNTPAHLAAMHSNKKSTLQLLINVNADITGNKNGDTIMHIINNYDHATLLPVQKFAHWKNKDNRTPLHCAVINNNLAIVKLLIENGANPNSNDNLMNYPIDYAHHNNDIKSYLNSLNVSPATEMSILEKLYNKFRPNLLKLEITSKNIIDSLQYSSFPNVEKILQKIDIQVTPLNINDMMFRNVFNGDGDTFNKLLKSGADLEAKFENELNLLDVAAFNGHISILGNNLIKSLKSDKALHIASLNNHVHDIILLLNMGVDVNTCDDDKITALHCASKKGHIKSMKVLISNGADVHAITKHGATTLHYASQSGTTESVKYLLDNEVDVNKVDKNETSSLHITAWTGNTTSMKLLLNKGANIETVNNKKAKAIHMAALSGKYAAVEMLLNAGCDSNALDFYGYTAIHYSCSKGCLKSIRLLLNSSSNMCTKTNLTPLHIASFTDNLDVVKTLLEHKIDANILGVDNIVPLHLAVLGKHTATAQFLLKNNANPNLLTKNNLSPLHVAAKTNNELLINLLLDNGAELNQTSSYNTTALHFAAEYGSVDAIQTLIKRGINIEAMASLNSTSLHFAVLKNQLIASEVLLSLGANVNATTLKKTNPLHVAVENLNLDLIKLLLANKANVNSMDDYNITPLHIAADKGNAQIVSLLLEYQADVNIVNKDQATAFQLAAMKGHLDTMKLLLNDKNINKVGVLHIATIANQLESVKLLLDFGTNINDKDKNLSTPLHISATNNFCDLTKLLISRGANINVIDENKACPLHYAVLNGHADSVEQLVKLGADVNLMDSNENTPLDLAIIVRDKVQILMLENEENRVKGFAYFERCCRIIELFYRNIDSVIE